MLTEEFKKEALRKLNDLSAEKMMDILKTIGSVREELVISDIIDISSSCKIEIETDEKSDGEWTFVFEGEYAA